MSVDDDLLDDLLYEPMPPGRPVVCELRCSAPPMRLPLVGVTTDPDLAPEGYIDELIAMLAECPDAVEAPGEDPEPL